MKKFEYQLLESTNGKGIFSGIDFQELTNRLNELGRQGWEVVSVLDTALTSTYTQCHLITLKRELP